MAIYSPRMWWVAVALLLWAPHTHCREFTHEDIRETLLSIVRVMRSSDSKLERHELREKALGEQLKKQLAGLDKKHKALEPLISKISRLDDRLSNVETILLQKEEREKASQKKIDETLANIQKTLQTLTNPPPKVPADLDNSLSATDDAVLRRIDATDAKIDAVKKEIKGLKSSLSMDSLRTVCLDVASNTNSFDKYISEADKLLNKYELKLNEYNVTTTKTPVDFEPYLNEVSLADDAWHNKMSEVMERQEKDLVKIQRLLSDAESMWKDLPKVMDLQRSTNQTLEAIARATETTMENSDKSADKVMSKIRNMGDMLQNTNKDIQQSLTESNTLIETISRNFLDLLNDVESLKATKQVTIETHDNVIATKKRLEYGVRQIIQELGHHVAEQLGKVNKTINGQLNTIESSITGNQNTATNNMTFKIDSEVSQVWRQIGVMRQNILMSKEALASLTNYTHEYANSSTTALNKVKTELDDITTKIDTLTSNMNYGLGQLSVTTQEFHLIAKDLSKAFNDIKNPKKPDAGPGPHMIDGADKPT